MLGYKYTLFCLIGNDKNDRILCSAKIDPEDTVQDLKQHIKDEIANFLKDVDASQLKLWRVEIPDDQEIDFSSLAPEDELKPTWDISDYWKNVPLKKHFHVLVKLPAGKYPIS